MSGKGKGNITVLISSSIAKFLDESFLIPVIMCGEIERKMNTFLGGYEPMITDEVDDME